MMAEKQLKNPPEMVDDSLAKASDPMSRSNVTDDSGSNNLLSVDEEREAVTNVVTVDPKSKSNDTNVVNSYDSRLTNLLPNEGSKLVKIISKSFKKVGDNQMNLSEDEEGETGTNVVTVDPESDEESEAVINGITVDPKSKKIVLKLHTRKSATIHNKWVLIYDTASTVHLFMNIDLFEGVPEPVDENEVSFVGFNTDSGYAFPVSKGKLKFPFAGIEAYYNPTTIGNIVSESLLAKSHHITESRYDDSSLDTVTACRRGGNHSENLYFARGFERIFVAKLSKTPQPIAHKVMAVSILPIKDDIEGQVQDCLHQLGLTEAEINFALAISRNSTPTDMRDQLETCLKVLRYGSDTIVIILRKFDETLSTLSTVRNGLPSVSEFDKIIDDMRNLDIADPGTLDKVSRVRTSNSVSSNKDLNGGSEVRVRDTCLKVSVVKKDKGLDQLVIPEHDVLTNCVSSQINQTSDDNFSAIFHYQHQNNASDVNMKSQTLKVKSLKNHRNDSENQSNKDNVGDLINHRQTSKLAIEPLQGPSKGGSSGLRTAMHDDVKSRRAVSFATTPAESMNRPSNSPNKRGTVSKISNSIKMKSSGDNLNGGLSLTSINTTISDGSVGEKRTLKESNETTQGKSLNPLFSLWLLRSKLSLGDLLVGTYVSTIGLTTRSEIVAISLEQLGLGKKQVERVAYIEKLHRLTSFVGLETLKKIVQYKSIGGLREDINPADVDNYRDHLHDTDCPCSMGKMTTPPAKHFDLAADGIHSLHCDIIQLSTEDKSVKFWFLVGVDQMTQFIFVVHIKSLQDKEALRGFEIIRKAYKCHGKYKLVRVVLDNAGAFLSKKFQESVSAKGLECIFSTPGLHVRIAEATIRQIKSLARTTVIEASNNKIFKTAFVPFLIPWVVDSINFTLRSGHDSLSPYSRFTGKTVCLQNHFPAAFLDIVAVPEITNDLLNLEPRARLGFVVARDMSSRGGVVTIMDFASGRFMKRRDLKVQTGEFYVKKANEFLNSAYFKKGPLFNKEFTLGNLSNFDLASEKYDVSPIQARGAEDNVLYGDADTSEDPSAEIDGENNLYSDSDSDDNISSESDTDHFDTSDTHANTDASTGFDVTSEPEVILSTTVEKSQFSQDIVINSNKVFSIDIEPDGSCFFSSISYSFKQYSGNSALELRHMVCDFIMYNQFEEFNTFTIRDYVITASREMISKDVNFSGVEVSDKEAFFLYIATLKRADGWAESLEIEILARIKGIQILIFQKSGKNIKLVDNFGSKTPGIAPKPCFLLFDGVHYEPLNFIDKTVLDNALEQLNLKRLEGEVTDNSFLYSNLFRFRNVHEYRVTLTEVSGVNPDEPLKFDHKVGGFKVPHNSSEELLDDIKFANQFCLLTIGEPIQSAPSVSTNSIKDILGELKAESEGVKSLRKRRPQQVEKAIRDEISQMHSKKVWEYLDPKAESTKTLCRNKKPIPVIMLEKEKFDSQGVFVKVKARAVALGNQQDLLEQWQKEAPTAAIQSFYIIIFLAAKFNIALESYDVTGAFLNARLPEDETEIVIISKKHAIIACQLNPDLKSKVRNDGSMLARLKMCLYGLKQSPRKWYLTIREVLRKLGLIQSEHDSCLFYLVNEIVGRNYLLLFVDDMLIAFQSEQLKKSLYEALIQEFGEISSQSGPVISFLGITIRQEKDFISLDQEGFITKLLHSLNLPKVPIYTNPVRSDFKVCHDRFLKKQSEADPARLKRMRQLAMAVMYCALRTRRDVLFATSFLSSISCPEKEDIDAIIRVIVYLFNTIGKRQFYYRAGKILLLLYIDASHNLFADARGHQCAQLYADGVSAALDMSCNKAKAVANSSYEEELVTLNTGVDKGIQTSLMFTELKVPHELPMVVYSDNEAAVLTATQEHINKMGRTKFMNRKLFYIFDKVQAKWVIPTHVSTHENLADIGTKNLLGSQYDYLANKQFTRMSNKTPYGTDILAGGGSNSDGADEPKLKNNTSSSSKSESKPKNNNNNNNGKTGGAAVKEK